MRSCASFLLGRIAFAALACVLVVAGCAAIELGYRIHTGRPVLSLANWRAWRIEYLTFGDRGKFDPVLGWVTRDWYADEGYNTVAHGIRRNPREQDAQIVPGAILAVGGGFTDGGENVDDDETWPAQLERLLGTRVLNAGVPGYVADQIVLRAEQLLAQLRPKTLVLGFVGDEIPRARLSSFGVSKPYFTLENGALVFHPPHRPYVAPDPAMPVWQVRTRDLLGYSAVLDVVLDLVASGYWIGNAGQPVIESVDNDPIGVTCALLQRLKRQADAAGVRLLLFMQHGRIVLTLEEAPREDASKVTQCAAAAGIEVVDQFRPLRALAVSDLAAFRGFYLKRALSPKGNRHAAEMLMRAIDRSAKVPPSAAVAPPAGVKKQ